MSRRFYISDLHLGHQNAIRFDERPFANCDEMNETIIANWNAVVTREDEVYVLGDFAWNAAVGLEVVRKLNGKKYLIIGNHDKNNEELEKEFIWCKPYEEIFDLDTRVILCHYPIAHWKSADKGSIHLYGHIHQSRDSEPFEDYKALMRLRDIPYRCYNVGCMLPYMSYTPRTLKEILSSCGDSFQK